MPRTSNGEDNLAKLRRVAVVAYTEYPTDPRVRREAETLVADGYQVHVIGVRPKAGPLPTHLEGAVLHEVPLTIARGGMLRYVYQYALFFLLSSALLLRLHFRGRFDLVHVHSLPDFLVFCALPLKLGRTRILLDLHEALPEIFMARFGGRRNTPAVRFACLLERMSCKLAHHVIAANDGIKRAIVSRGVPSEHVTTVYNAVERDTGRDLEKTVIERYKLPHGRLIVYAGGINPERDLETLFRATARLPPALGVRLVLAGDGDPEYVRELIGLAASLNLSDRTQYLGRLPLSEARALVALSSVGVVTLQANPLTELAWPTRILEFVSHEKPLVVPNLRFIRETLKECARYYQPGDAEDLAGQLELVLQSPILAREIAQCAKRRCERFAWSQTRGVLLSVCRPHRESPSL